MGIHPKTPANPVPRYRTSDCPISESPRKQPSEPQNLFEFPQRYFDSPKARGIYSSSLKVSSIFSFKKKKK
jgi:hypothetical protein